MDGGTVNSDTPLVAVEWEDITAYSRTAIPEDFEPYRLRKLTCGMLWKDTTEYVVIVGDYDITNEGKDYRHNDFHIIPRGVIRKLTYLTDAGSLVSCRSSSAPAMSLVSLADRDRLLGPIRLIAAGAVPCKSPSSHPPAVVLRTD